MSNFVNKITEMQYNSISDFVQHYIEDVHDGNFITIFADWKFTQSLLPEMIKVSTPVDIEYGTPDIIGYDKEYSIAIVNPDEVNDELFVNFAYCKERKDYLGGFDMDDATIIIGDISDELMQMITEQSKNIVKVSF